MVDSDGHTLPERKHGLRFERSISVGNIMTLVAMLAPMALWGFQVHADVQALKAELPRIEQRQREADVKQDQLANETKREFKEELKEINLKLDRLIESKGERRDGRNN